ncbi:hypothetical protein BJF87_21320 [Gordonia sp. CNJ-863]|uniref:hypothetical protein n=1 Tax=Gordonia sp. CNJ-863 TaxID=1904963 RepID=UPI0009625969|nr:hypothetical protein [Gordonia sp. CNJ-863]OLT47758.1 hypothetical protein BJF87_21320 [Gordonia sp. CNJ-863]
MTTSDEVQLLLDHVKVAGLEPKESARGWHHIGAIICDAALQRQAKYKTHVRPRVVRLIELWPDADTLSGFKRRMKSESISEALDWKGPQKLAVIDALTETFEEAGVETVADLAGTLADETRGRELRSALRRIAYVGPKTVDYIAVLAGSAEHVAVDMHIKGFAREAGVSYWNDYSRVSQLVKDSAEAGGWSTGALDAAIWSYMSERGNG